MINIRQISHSLQILHIVFTKFHIVNPVNKGHSREPENVPFMNSCPFYTGSNYMHYSLMGKMRLLFID